MCVLRVNQSVDSAMPPPWYLVPSTSAGPAAGIYICCIASVSSHCSLWSKKVEIHFIYRTVTFEEHSNVL